MHELEGMARSMTVGPLPSDQVARLLRSYRELAKERADVKAHLVKLAPAWAELRKVLNELNRVLGALTRQIGISYVFAEGPCSS